MNYMQIEKASVANGKGIRTVLWVSGCSLHCKGCQNPESWDFNAGKPFDDKAKQELFCYLENPYIQGITFSGGHPLDYKNAYTIYELILEIKEKYPQKDIWLYTGYSLTYEDFYSHPLSWMVSGEETKTNILQMCDVVVDGEFREELRDTTLPFRGSSNQRLIDVKKTIDNKKIILFKV